MFEMLTRLENFRVSFFLLFYYYKKTIRDSEGDIKEQRDESDDHRGLRHISISILDPQVFFFLSFFLLMFSYCDGHHYCHTQQPPRLGWQRMPATTTMFTPSIEKFAYYLLLLINNDEAGSDGFQRPPTTTLTVTDASASRASGIYFFYFFFALLSFIYHYIMCSLRQGRRTTITTHHHLRVRAVDQHGIYESTLFFYSSGFWKSE